MTDFFVLTGVMTSVPSGGTRGGVGIFDSPLRLCPQLTSPSQKEKWQNQSFSAIFLDLCPLKVPLKNIFDAATEMRQN